MAGVESLAPDLVIVDISLAESSGLELIKDLQSRHPSLPALVLSTHDESLYGERALRAGAKGYVMKQAPTSEVMTAIRAVLAGELYLSDGLRTKMVHKHIRSRRAPRESGIESLSDRELEVFDLLAGDIPRRASRPRCI